MVLSAVERGSARTVPGGGNAPDTHDGLDGGNLGQLVSGLPDSPDRGGTDECRSPASPDTALAPSVDPDRWRFVVPGLRSSRQSGSLHPLQEWEGYVVGVGEETFEARLLDVTAGAPYDTESASIPLEDVSFGDRKKMKPGSVFRWVIGYEQSPGGTRKRVSLIVFRDLPVVTESDLHAGRKWAREIMERFDL